MKLNPMKKRLTFFLYLSLALLAGSSCTKDDDGDTVVEGQVVDRHTGAPVPNATVTVYSSDGSSAGGAYNGREFDKQADGNGNFSFSFAASSKKDYALRAFKDPGYYTAWTDAAYLSNNGSNKKLKVKMQAPAWVRVKLINKPPLDPISNFYIQSFSEMIAGQDYIDIYDIKGDTSFVRLIQGNTQRTFLSEIKNMDGSTIRSNPSAYFPALDTTDLVITY